LMFLFASKLTARGYLRAVTDWPLNRWHVRWVIKPSLRPLRHIPGILNVTEELRVARVASGDGASHRITAAGPFIESKWSLLRCALLPSPFTQSTAQPIATLLWAPGHFICGRSRRRRCAHSIC